MSRACRAAGRGLERAERWDLDALLNPRGFCQSGFNIPDVSGESLIS
jgi:hypothetical protein